MIVRLLGIAEEVSEVASLCGWERSGIKVAGTGTVYVELMRSQDFMTELLVVRVANHKQIHHKWVKTYSLSPYELRLVDVGEILSRKFGDAGDVVEMRM